jgi:hypothetical protein
MFSMCDTTRRKTVSLPVHWDHESACSSLAGKFRTLNSLNILQSSRRAFLRRAGIAAAVALAPLFVTRPTGSADDRAKRQGNIRITDHGARTHRSDLNTAAIQAAIDACHAAGGGTVRVPQGRFRTGALLLKSNVHLHLEEGAILQGSRDWQDYRAFIDWSDGRRQWGDGDWSNALITALNATNIRIDGPGAIDGVDCTRPQGEEGFRGPHAVLLRHCADIQIRDITIRHAGNYALMCFDSRQADVIGVKVRGGHDALHTQRCERFRVHHCDFRTGDDCFAGCDNVHFDIRHCRINSSCNGFRLGCEHLVVKDCHLWGPGEYEHKISGRTNMLGAFVHFAPRDRNPQRPSDHWLIENLTIDQAQALYLYDFERGGWMQGQPARDLHFKNIQATNLVRTTRVLGDAARQFRLTLENVELALHDAHLDQPVLDINQFDALTLRDVRLANSGRHPVLTATRGNRVRIDRLVAKPDNLKASAFDAVDHIEKER